MAIRHGRRSGSAPATSSWRAHEVARILAHDRVLSVVRAPFTRHQGTSGHGEVDEDPRGTGLQLAVGELLVWPGLRLRGR
jgi:hypothetical protein